MTSFDYRLDPIYAIKECSSCGSLYTSNCGCSKGSLEDKILVPIPDSSQRPLKIENFCLDCGDPIHGLHCQGCALIRKTFEEVFQDFQDTSESSDDNTNVVNAPREPFVVKHNPGENSSPSAHYGYNCPPKVPIISNPELPNNQTVDEPPQSVQQQCLFRTCQKCGCNEYDGVCFYCKVGNGTPINVSTPYSSNNSPSVPNPTPQPPTYSYEICGNNAYYGYDCAPQVPFIHNPEPCYNQDFNFPQTLPSFQQQRLGCEKCGGPHETFQCQPMNEDYYHEQNSCYDSNSFGFDQVQPRNIPSSANLQFQKSFLIPKMCFSIPNELLNSSNKLMEQMTTLCDLVGQAIQKKEEEKRIAEEQAAKDRYWKIPICYDDDEDDTIIITPVLPIEEPVNSLSMGDKHLDTIPETESDEFIKSSVEILVQIPSESEGIPDKMCDVPLCENTTPLNALNEHSEIVVNSNDDNSSSDDDSFSIDDIDYVDASPPDVEIVSLEVVEIVDPEVERIDDDILLIKDDTLREKLLNVNLLVAKIDALRDNPTPSSDVVTKSTSTFSNLFLEETNTFDNSIPESETYRFNLEEISSGSSTTHSELSPPDYKAFYIDNDHFKEKSSGSTTTHIEPDPGDLTSIDPGIRKNVSTTNVNVPLEDDQSSLFAYVVWIFLAFLTYPVVPPYLLSTRNEDTIFDPGISIYHSFMPDVPHRSGTFMKFNVYPNHLNESPMEILPSTCFPMDQ
ncbi:hypothetical protein Tco_0771404 [Tanacetum coccineum]|uniref:Uncharacterized protein n=1 Tax=Tanacetum coccineum TaxID=301880 RepID=A0ABQ4ZEY0_9ASTR